MAKHQRGGILSSSDLNLGYPIRDTELTNQLRHSCQNRVHGRVNDRAMGQRCDKAFVALSKTDQSPALFWHQSCAMTSSISLGCKPPSLSSTELIDTAMESDTPMESDMPASVRISDRPTITNALLVGVGGVGV